MIFLDREIISRCAPFRTGADSPHKAVLLTAELFDSDLRIHTEHGLNVNIQLSSSQSHFSMESSMVFPKESRGPEAFSSWVDSSSSESHESTKVSRL